MAAARNIRVLLSCCFNANDHSAMRAIHVKCLMEIDHKYASTFYVKYFYMLIKTRGGKNSHVRPLSHKCNVVATCISRNCI
jgi:hypothetical protein